MARISLLDSRMVSVSWILNAVTVAQVSMDVATWGYLRYVETYTAVDCHVSGSMLRMLLTAHIS